MLRGAKGREAVRALSPGWGGRGERVREAKSSPSYQGPSLGGRAWHESVCQGTASRFDPCSVPRGRSELLGQTDRVWVQAGMGGAHCVHVQPTGSRHDPDMAGVRASRGHLRSVGKRWEARRQENRQPFAHRRSSGKLSWACGDYGNGIGRTPGAAQVKGGSSITGSGVYRVLTEGRACGDTGECSAGCRRWQAGPAGPRSGSVVRAG